MLTIDKMHSYLYNRWNDSESWNERFIKNNQVNSPQWQEFTHFDFEILDNVFEILNLYENLTWNSFSDKGIYDKELKKEYFLIPVYYSDEEPCKEYGKKVDIPKLILEVKNLLSVVIPLKPIFKDKADEFYKWLLKLLDLLNELLNKYEERRIGNCKDEFFDDTDWLYEIEECTMMLQEYHRKWETLVEEKPDLQNIMRQTGRIIDDIYSKDFETRTLGCYMPKQKKVVLYIKNIFKAAEDDKCNVGEVLNTVLAHEYFHALQAKHIQANINDVQKIIEGPQMAPDLSFFFGNGRKSRKEAQRKTVFESLAKYFEYKFAEKKCYRYKDVCGKFNGRCARYPNWPYAGADGLIKGTGFGPYRGEERAFREIYWASVSVIDNKGIDRAYKLLDAINKRGCHIDIFA